MRTDWEEYEDRFIINNADLLKDQAMAEKLSEIKGKPVSIKAVRRRRRRLGIVKGPGRGLCQVVRRPI